MSVKIASEKTFGREVLAATTPVLVEFSAEHAPTTATLDEVARDLQGKFKIVKVHVDRHPTLKDEYGVRGLPTLMLFKYGKPVARRVGSQLSTLEIQEWIDGALVLALATRSTAGARSTTDFKLANGLQVVVIPDYRVPVVTHMMWYKAGSGDELKNLSGLARLLTQLTFKSLDKIAGGDVTKTIQHLGGEINANCFRDATVFWERVPRDELKAVMTIEADRMVNLRLTNHDIATEREVMLELRCAGVDNNPEARLSEKMRFLLYRAHPYGLPEIGTAKDLILISLDDVKQFHRTHYAPDKAVVVVSGDVTPEEVHTLADEIYGSIPPRSGEGRNGGTKLPSQITARRCSLEDRRIETAQFRRVYAAPGWGTAALGEVEALHALTQILVGGYASRLYRRLVVESKVATDVSGHYRSNFIEAGELTLVVRSTSADMTAVEAAVDDALNDIRTNGVLQKELERAKKTLVANFFYSANDQLNLANLYGSATVIGRTIKDVEEWPGALSRVSAADVKLVAQSHVTASRSVTGWLSREGGQRRAPYQNDRGTRGPLTRAVRS
jgi:zinc protease